MKVVMAPQLSASLNPYQHLLQKGIERADSGIECTGWDRLSLRRLIERREETDVLHLHWLEHLYSAGNAYRTYRRFAIMALGLILARVMRKRIVYTVHNLTQHGNAYPTLNWLGNRLIFRLANAIHVHDVAGRKAVATTFGRREKVFVIAHGSYIGSYPNDLSGDEARIRLGIPAGSFTYLCLGQIRSNKGLESLLEAFRVLDAPSTRLVIAGWAPDASYGEGIRHLAAADSRVMVHLRLVPNDEIQCYMNACDVCVLPYKTVTTSGAALLAFSFGRPIIAPDIGCFPELAGEGRGILYDREQPGSLGAALLAARQLDQSRASLATIEFAKGLDWTGIGQQHAAVYRALLAGDSSRGPVRAISESTLLEDRKGPSVRP